MTAPTEHDEAREHAEHQEHTEPLRPTLEELARRVVDLGKAIERHLEGR